MPSSRKLKKKKQLRKYQIYMAKFIKRYKIALLAVDMGLGKTAAVLTVARRLLDEFAIRKVLIVAPKYVAEYTWPEEIEGWEHLKVLDYSVIVGTPKQRMAALERDAEVYLINRENLPWLWKTLGEKKFDFDMLVYDEASRLKSGKKRTKGGKTKGRSLSEFGALSNMRKLVDYVVEMSGTIAPNGLIDLWGPAYILDQGERLGGTKKAFLDRWFDSDYMGWTHTPKHFAEKQIMGRLSDVMVSLRAEDHLELPPVRYNNIMAPMPKAAMREYNQFKKTLVSEVYDVEAMSKGVLTNKLLQFANGSMYREIEDSWPVKKEIVKIHDAKLSALESVVEEANGEPILLAYSFKFDRIAIQKRFPKAVWIKDDPDWKKKWDKGKIQLLITNPASIGHGLNLQYGGHIACWYGLTWSLEIYQQFNKRLPRSGQRSPFVNIHHIICPGTVDEAVLAAMQDRGATQDRITNTVRKTILAA